MNKLIVLILSVFSFIPFLNSQNLQFKEAVFYNCGSGEADGDKSRSTPLFNKQITIPDNQVIKVTFASCTSINAKVLISNGYVKSPTTGFLAINDQIIDPETLNELWLPAGTYEITGYESAEPYTDSGTFKGVLSGLLYEVVN
jgi:hypothetical protein